MNVGIFIYDQAEVLDFSGPYEVFSTAFRVSQCKDSCKVFLVSESGETVTARAGYRVIPDYSFSDHPEIDVLIVVGGEHHEQMNKQEVLDWITVQSNKAKITASVCTGVFLLAKAQVLHAHRVTTHWEDIPQLKAMFPNLKVIEGVRWVDEGALVSSGGISAGIDMSLHLLSRLFDGALAEKTAKQMEFAWTKSSGVESQTL